MRLTRGISWPWRFIERGAGNMPVATGGNDDDGWTRQWWLQGWEDEISVSKCRGRWGEARLWVNRIEAYKGQGTWNKGVGEKVSIRHVSRMRVKFTWEDGWTRVGTHSDARRLMKTQPGWRERGSRRRWRYEQRKAGKLQISVATRARGMRADASEISPALAGDRMWERCSRDLLTPKINT